MDISVIDIISSTSVDGPGFRTSIYAAGCVHKCKGCHNPGSWDVRSGKIVTTDEVVEKILRNASDNVTFSGGDPMYQAEAFADIAKKIKTMSHKDIWCYTGYKIEQLVNNTKAMQLLQYVDVLVDGKYEEEERDATLRFRGSKNQRIVDVQETLRREEVVERELSMRKSKYLK